MGSIALVDQFSMDELRESLVDLLATTPPSSDEWKELIRATTHLREIHPDIDAAVNKGISLPLLTITSSEPALVHCDGRPEELAAMDRI